MSQPSAWAWCQWRTTVLVPVGEVEIIARAWDTTAAMPPKSAAQLWNPKGYVNNSWPRIHVRASAGTAG